MMKPMQYKKIRIQSLPPLEQPAVGVISQQTLLSNVSFANNWSSEYTSLCYLDSSISQQRVEKPFELMKASFFFDAFWYAYTKHGDIVLVPDEIWIMISFYLSTYIDKNGEKLRKKLVKHDGIKTLVIAQIVNSKQESEQEQKNWDYFFDQIIKAIQKQTVKGVVQTFACDFSTTNKIYQTISTAIIMNSLKNYFEYQRFMAGCGINNAYMAGTRQDWVKILTKLNNLIQFDVDGELKKYIEHMNVIIKNFIDTFDGNPNVAWWNTIMTTAEKREVYGGDEMEIQGWMLHFFGKYEKSHLYGFPEFTIKVPIKLINTWTQKEKELVLVSDWVSVSKLNQKAYKPDVGMTIFQLKQGPIKKQSTQKNEAIIEAVTYGQKVKLNNQYLKANNIVVFLPQITPKTEKKKEKPRNFTIQKLAKKERAINF